MRVAVCSATPRSVAPETNISRCFAISSGFLLTHGPAQHVRAAQRVARQQLCDLHHLLLVQDDAVGFFEQRFQVRVEIIDLALVIRMPARDEIVNHARLQRTWPKQRDQRDEVVKPDRAACA